VVYKEEVMSEQEDKMTEAMFHECADTPAFKRFEQIKDHLKNGGNFLCVQCGEAAPHGDVTDGCFKCLKCGSQNCGD
jgi:hypothetical protein